jgi:crotonobetainyl-CoA:carnitine CoA-transferase CaiB-like acyl-CoA transferase
MTLPLAGVKVLDLTRALAGPYCTMVLGDLGADVIKVERLPGGDDSRRLGPHRDGESYCFAQVNRNKRGIALDLKRPAGQAALLEIAAGCDVLVENFRPGTTPRLGCDYESVRARNPQIVYCSISGFGQTGPYALRPAYDIIAQGVSGLLSMTGHPDGPPAKVGVAIHDVAGGSSAVQAILAAHIAKLNGHGGQHIDISLVEAGVAWTVWEAAAFFGSGEIASRVGTRHRRIAPYQAFRTQDGYVTIGANTDRMWQALCRVLDRPEWIDSPQYGSPGARIENVDALARDIEALLIGKTTEYWVETLLAAGIAAGPVNTYEQMLHDPHLLARGVTTVVEHPTLGPLDALSSALRLSATPPQIRRPAPVFGQHSAQVLGEFGIGAEEVRAMQASGAVFDPSLAETVGAS